MRVTNYFRKRNRDGRNCDMRGFFVRGCGMDFVFFFVFINGKTKVVRVLNAHSPPHSHFVCQHRTTSSSLSFVCQSPPMPYSSPLCLLFPCLLPTPSCHIDATPNPPTQFSARFCPLKSDTLHYAEWTFHSSSKRIQGRSWYLFDESKFVYFYFFICASFMFHVQCIRITCSKFS